MLRITRSLAVFILAGAVAPVAANAASLGTILHLHPETKDARISFVLFNKSDVAREVTVEGHTYALTPKQAVPVSAHAGSKVTETRPGAAATETVLFTVDRLHKGTTVYIN
jgi:hypothetical protein